MATLVRRYGFTVAALMILLTHLASFDVHEQPLLMDVRYYTYFSWLITEGGVPHVDYFDNKTQLSSFVGALFYLVGEGLGVDAPTACLPT